MDIGKRRVRFFVKGIFIVTLASGLLMGCEGRNPESERKESVAEPAVEQEVEPLEITSEPEPEEPEGEASEGEEVAEESPKSVGKLRELEAQIQTMLAGRQSPGEVWSVYVEDLETGNIASVGNMPLESASLIKLFTAVTVCQNMDEVAAIENYQGETLDLMRQMIRVSDNDAANTLVRRLGGGDAVLGMQKVNLFCQENGFGDTHMGRLMLDFNAADDNYTSVEDCGRLVAGIYRNTFAGSDVILTFMKEQERTGKIPAGLPEGTESANKTGELNDVENDVAIVFAEGRPYVVCVMSNQLTDAGAARTQIMGLSEFIHEHFTEI